ncbi:MAG: ABC transporter permease subunit [Pirellulales bacterium]
MTNAALWRKTILECRTLLAACAVFMFGVHWLRVWIASYFSTRDLEYMLSLLPEPIEQLMPVSYTQMASTAGRIAAEYDDPVVLLLMTVWSISRGSDAVSGELNRGTMEMVLAQPVTRTSVVVIQGLVTVAGAALLACAAWLGTLTGLATVTLETSLAPRVFLPPAMNLFALGAFLAGLTTMISAGTNYRARTIGIVGGFYAVSMVVKIVGRMVPNWDWLSYVTFFTAFEPQLLVGDATRAWSVSLEVGGAHALGGLGYDGVLVGLGLLAYAVAAVIFAHRDLPAPL